MYKTILLATDFAGRSARAEQHAVALAAAFEARLEVMHAVLPVAPDVEQDPELERFTRHLLERGERALEAMVARARAKGIRADHHLVVGAPWREVLKRADAIDADLIVVGTHGAPGEGGEAYFGTTSHRVFFAARTPLLVVQGDADAQHGA